MVAAVAEQYFYYEFEVELMRQQINKCTVFSILLKMLNVLIIATAVYTNTYVQFTRYEYDLMQSAAITFLNSIERSWEVLVMSYW